MLAQPRCHVDLCQAVDGVGEASIPSVDHHMMLYLPGVTSTSGGIPPGCAAQHAIDRIQTRSRCSWFKSNGVSQNLGDQNLDHRTRHLGRAPSCQQESHWDRLSLHVCQVLAQFPPLRHSRSTCHSPSCSPARHPAREMPRQTALSGQPLGKM